jgi:prepilin-type N-terminal cleavage/methylation domain-containing protein
MRSAVPVAGSDDAASDAASAGPAAAASDAPAAATTAGPRPCPWPRPRPSPLERRAGRSARRAGAFSLVEVMVALALGGVVVAGAVAAFRESLVAEAAAKHEWIAFSVAEQQMELLSTMPRDGALLAGNVAAGAAPGLAADALCSDIAFGPQRFKVDALGAKTTSGEYEMCLRITDGNPSGALKNVRVVVLYPSFGAAGHVVLQTIR